MNLMAPYFMPIVVTFGSGWW